MLDSIYATYTAVATTAEPVLVTISTNYYTFAQFMGAYTDHLGCVIDKLPLISPLTGFIELVFSGTRPELCLFKLKA